MSDISRLGLIAFINIRRKSEPIEAKVLENDPIQRLKQRRQNDNFSI